jgi:hypothetical protein
MVRWIEELKKDIVKFAIIVEQLDEREEADKATIEMRKKACEGCDKNVNNKCIACDCYLELKVMTKVNRDKLGRKEITHCPLGKWEDKLVLTYIKNF